MSGLVLQLAIGQRGLRFADILAEDYGFVFQKHVKEYSSKLALALARFTVRAIKRRVPILTRNLRNSIKAPKGKQFRSGSREMRILIQSEAPYAAFQGYGFTPHYIPIEYIEQHERNPKQPVERIINPRRYVYVTRSSYYMRPIIAVIKKNLPTMAGRMWYQTALDQGTINRKGIR